MGVISGADYLNIATDYANARDRVVSAVVYLFEAVYAVVLLNELIPEVDLLTDFFDSYEVNSDLLKSPVTFLSAVRSLNNHVLNRSSSITLDEFLDSEGITVPRSWADLSGANGQIISESNISP